MTLRYFYRNSLKYRLFPILLHKVPHESIAMQKYPPMSLALSDARCPDCLGHYRPQDLPAWFAFHLASSLNSAFVFICCAINDSALHVVHPTLTCFSSYKLIFCNMFWVKNIYHRPGRTSRTSRTGRTSRTSYFT